MRSPSPRRRRRSGSRHRSPIRRRRSPSPARRRRISPPRRRRSRSYSPAPRYRPSSPRHRRDSLQHSSERNPSHQKHRQVEKAERTSGAIIQEAESTVSDERRARKRSSERHGFSQSNSHTRSPSGKRQSPAHISTAEERAPLRPEHSRRASYRDRSPVTRAEQRSPGRPRFVENDPRPTQKAPSKKFDQTSQSLHDRFTQFDKNNVPFVPKENITVGIERNVSGNAEAVLDAFIPNQILISRRRGEGEIPLSERDEFLGPVDDDHSERRIISVEQKRMSPPRQHASLEGRENFSVPSRDRQWTGDWGNTATGHAEKFSRGAGDRDERQIVRRRGAQFFTEDTNDDIIRSPNDLRHNLRRNQEERTDVRQRIGARRGDRRGGDVYDGDFDNFRVRRVSGEELPDFSQRPDKGKFEEWKQHPESIPKGSSYYEHDNRGEINYWERRGRGQGQRGGFRGRGRGRERRGGYQAGYRDDRYRGGGRGGFRNRDDDRFGNEWKHDKFAETEESHEPPSSTT